MNTLFGGGSSASSGPTAAEQKAQADLQAEQKAEEDRQKQDAYARSVGLRGRSSLYGDMNTGSQTPLKLGAT